MSQPPLLGLAAQVSDLRANPALLRDEPRDIELHDFFMADVLAGDWRPLAEEAQAALRGHGGRLGIHGPFWGLDISNPDPDVQAIVVRRMDQALDVCAFLEASQMVIHSPYTLWDHYNLDHFAWRSAHDWIIANCHACLRPAVARAEALGVTLVIENVQDKDPDIRAELVRSFGSKAVALSVDTGHAHFMNGVGQAPPVDFFIRRAGDLLQHVHLHDGDGNADRHWRVGDGSIPWAAVFRALSEAPAMPRLILELSDKAGIPASIARLRDMGLAR
ncbi:sugar phosphate isomerase/epimerase [Paracoccus sp. (in: a-proteobacteria)]|uniref:sugar phosphate isomerase/epimerase family protein n=1 Tax=Paracoccus sp. TaxID=267 RepID=UPI0026E09B4B|nr:sugar phosphate isomerase/epimerase family protein [Paracoccus sp. (in: a-proteobacteria)]MDO5370178.1 sugar phosphate isomerase/epimerase family protein [Paracoccus sp. (in: a-proteobacteria)]